MNNEQNIIEKSYESSAAPEAALRVLARLISRRIIRERALENTRKFSQTCGNNSGLSNVKKMEGNHESTQ